MLVTGLIEPVIAAFLGAMLLGESMNGRTFLGSIGVLISVAFILDVRAKSRLVEETVIAPARAD